MTVTETWLTDKILYNEILPKGYSITRKDCRSRCTDCRQRIKVLSSVVIPT